VSVHKQGELRQPAEDRRSLIFIYVYLFSPLQMPAGSAAFMSPGGMLPFRSWKMNFVISMSLFKMSAEEEGEALL
jgi:hypothetical protein